MRHVKNLEQMKKKVKAKKLLLEYKVLKLGQPKTFSVCVFLASSLWISQWMI